MKKPKIRFEDLPKKQYKFWNKKYEKTGRLIENGRRVIFTDWAIQNGVGDQNDNNVYVKIRNGRNARQIIVKKNNNQQGSIYWAGFWRKIK